MKMSGIANGGLESNQKYQPAAFTESWTPEVAGETHI